MGKDVMRKMVINRLSALSQDKRNEIEKNIIKTLLQSSIWKDAKRVGVTVSHTFEWDTSQLIKEAWKEGKSVSVPKSIVDNKQLIFYELTCFSELEEGYAKLLEPKPELCQEVNHDEIDLLIVPGIVYDRRGYRIGFGGGYYDRFLQNHKLLSVSLVGDMQLVDEIPINKYDLAVDYLATESGLIKTN